MIASGHVYNLFCPFGYFFLHPPLQYFHVCICASAKPPSFILIRAALELDSDEKSVGAHRLKIDPKIQTPPGGQISASFQENQVSQKPSFGLVRGRKWFKIECNGTVLKLFVPPSRIFESKTAYEGKHCLNLAQRGPKIATYNSRYTAPGGRYT